MINKNKQQLKNKYSKTQMDSQVKRSSFTVHRSSFFMLFLALVLLQITFSSCEDEIMPTLADAPAVVVVDAWITNKPEPQIIKVTSSQAYFDNSPFTGISGATVQIADENLKVYDFVEQEAGIYVWTPADGETFGQVGLQYGLNIEHNGEMYNSFSKMNGVPPIDSISFEFEPEDGPFPEGYFAEFWARDIAGEGDTYWIKTFKNGQFLAKPNEINVAFDAGFSNGGNIDGLIFIPPIRSSINPFEEDEDGNFLSPYTIGDSVYVELHSITNEAFYFLNEVRLQTDRPGGFAELFATPLSNVVSNIIPSNENTEVVGFFNVAAVSGNGKKLVE